MSGTGKTESSNQGVAKGVIKRDHRVILAIHPEDAEKVFSSQSSYGENLTQDFRENVKALNQVYTSMQRYLQGNYRRDNAFYPELQDIYKDLQFYKRSVSDKIPMPTEEELLRDCLQLASQTPPFIHIVRDLQVVNGNEIRFISQFVAPTQKHDDKVIVAYRSALDTSIKELKSVVKDTDFGLDYARMYSGAKTIDEVPIQKGRADNVLKKIYLQSTQFGKDVPVTVAQNLKYINLEIYRRCFRPLLTQAIKEKLVISLSCESIRKSSFNNAEKVFDITLFLSRKELLNRYAALVRFLTPSHTSGLIGEEAHRELKARLENEEIKDHECNHALASILYDNAKVQAEPSIVTIQVAVEIMKLGEWLHKSNKKNEKDEETQELQIIIKKIKDHGGLLRARSSGEWSINEKFLKLMLKGKIPPILACTQPYDDLINYQGNIDISHYEHIYLIYKDRKITGKAVDVAIDLYEKNGDIYTLHILENLFGLGQRPDVEIKKFLAPVFMDRFQHVLRKSYARYLPFWSRIWLTLTSTEASSKQLDQIRQGRRHVSMQSLSLKKNRASRGSSSKRNMQKLVREKVESTRLTPSENNALESLIQYIDHKWETGKYPSRHQIIADGNERSQEYQRLIGFVDAGAASVKQIIQIPSKVEAIYASQSFLKENKGELISFFERKINETSSTIVHENRSMSLQKDSDQYKKEMYKALLSFIKLRV